MLEIAQHSIGGRFQFTAPDKSLSVANRNFAAIEYIVLDGRISTRLDCSRHVEFNVQEHRYFNHGYDVTSAVSRSLPLRSPASNQDR